MDWNKKCRLCLTDNPQRPIHALLCPELWSMLKEFCGIEIGGQDQMDLVCSGCMQIISSLKFFKSNQLVIKECRDFQTNMLVLKKEKGDKDDDCVIVEDAVASTSSGANAKECPPTNTLKRKSSTNVVNSQRQNLDLQNQPEKDSVERSKCNSETPLKVSRQNLDLPSKPEKDSIECSTSKVPAPVADSNERIKIKKCKVMLTRIKFDCQYKKGTSVGDNSTDTGKKVAESTPIEDVVDGDSHIVVMRPLRTYARKNSVSLEPNNNLEHPLTINHNKQKTIAASDETEEQTTITTKEPNNKVKDLLKITKDPQETTVATDEKAKQIEITIQEPNNKVQDPLKITKDPQENTNTVKESSNRVETSLIITKNTQDTTIGSAKNEKQISTTAKETENTVLTTQNMQEQGVESNKEKQKSIIAIVSPEVYDTEMIGKSQLEDISSTNTSTAQSNDQMATEIGGEFVHRLGPMQKQSKTVAWFPVPYNPEILQQTTIRIPSNLTIRTLSAPQTSQKANTLLPPQLQNNMTHISRTARPPLADAAVTASIALTSTRTDSLHFTQSSSSNNSSSSSQIPHEQISEVSSNLHTDYIETPMSTNKRKTPRKLYPASIASKYIPIRPKGYIPIRPKGDNVNKVKVLTVNELNTKHAEQIAQNPVAHRPIPVVAVVNPSNINPTAELTVRFIRRSSTFYIAILLYGRDVSHTDLNAQQSQYLSRILANNLKNNENTHRLLSTCKPDEGTLEILKYFKIDHLLERFL